MKLKTKKKTTKSKYVGCRANEIDRSKIQENADKWAQGNISAWVLFAAINFEPKKEHLEKEGIDE